MILMTTVKDCEFKRYPAEAYLHNALGCIKYGNIDNAYSEICYALTSAGADLSEYEKAEWRKCAARVKEAQLKGGI